MAIKQGFLFFIIEYQYRTFHWNMTPTVDLEIQSEQLTKGSAGVYIISDSIAARNENRFHITGLQVLLFQESSCPANGTDKSFLQSYTTTLGHYPE